MTVENDQGDRLRICEERDATFIVEASAGTGKTTVLLQRLVNILEMTDTPLRSVVAVTYTEKAAGEMRLRLREQIEKARAAAQGVEKARLERAFQQLEEAHISTIHGFCGDLLREYPVAAGIDPKFRMASETEARSLFARCFRSWMERTLEDPPEGIRRALRRRVLGKNETPLGSLRDAAWKLAESRDFPTPWSRKPVDRAAEAEKILNTLQSLAGLVEKASNRRSDLAIALTKIADYLEELRLRDSVLAERDLDGLEADLRWFYQKRKFDIWEPVGNERSFGKEVIKAEVVERRAAVRKELGAYLDTCEQQVAAALQQELQPVLESYRQAKEREGVLDFLDLLIRARDLLAGNQDVRQKLQARFTRIFVDEFQDTDPIQAEVLLLLSADDPNQADWTKVRPVNGKLFVVGDPKQSIYRFRRADIAFYKEAQKILLAGGAESLDLSTSHRSVPEIQSLVNASFAERMKESDGQARYVPLNRKRESNPDVDQPAVIALPVPRPYTITKKFQGITKKAINMSYPDAVGAFLESILQKDWRVEDRERGWIKLEAHHICILLRRFRNWGEDLAGQYGEALERRRIPHVLVGGSFYHAREEVLALRNALMAIERPSDALSVYATLRGPIFALSDAQLLRYRHEVGSLHPMARPDEVPEGLGEVAEALRILRHLHRGRNRRPIAQTLTQLLEETRAHAGIAIWPGGEQALGNVLRLVEHARKFEHEHPHSFRSFIDWLEAEAEAAEAPDAPVAEEGAEGVRISTIHKAKGLEFPVVILGDSVGIHREEPDRYIDPARRLWAMQLAGCKPLELVQERETCLKRDEEEAIRLAYVAATRARDLLVVPAIGDPDQCELDIWTDVLNPGIYPDRESRRSPRPVAGFGTESVLTRPRFRQEPVSVAPGYHRPQKGEHEVLWWDPQALKLDTEPSIQELQRELVQSHRDGSDATQSIAAWERWAEGRQTLVTQGQLPTRAACGIGAWARDHLGAAPEVEVHKTAAARQDRPFGPRFGSLVHAILAAVDLGGAEAEIRATAELRARLAGATAEELEAAIDATRTALRHELLLRAAGSPDCRREEPLVFALEDGTLAEGQVDLAFCEIGEGGPVWHVVDFKTHVELEASLPECRRQVKLYMDGIGKATGAPTRGYVLSI